MICWGLFWRVEPSITNVPYHFRHETSWKCTKRESAVNSLGSPSPFHPLLLLKLKVTVTSSGGQEDKSKSRDQLIQIWKEQEGRNFNTNYRCVNTGSPRSLYEPHKQHNMASHYKGLYGIFYKISMAWRRSQGCDCVARGLKWKINLCPWILRWICERGYILAWDFWLRSAGCSDWGVSPCPLFMKGIPEFKNVA